MAPLLGILTNEVDVVAPHFMFGGLRGGDARGLVGRLCKVLCIT